jgi:hypothetical protein
VTVRHGIRQAGEWAALDELLSEFAGRWDITWSEFPGGRMFAARPLPADWSSPWVVHPDAGELRAQILRREAGPAAVIGDAVAVPAA